MTDLGVVRRPSSRRRRAATLACAAAVVASGCFRGSLPPREFYRLSVPDSLTALGRPTGAPPLTGSIAVARYETPGIYATGSLVYRVGSSSYGAYPSREWAIPLGEMLGSITEEIVRQRSLTSGRVVYPPSAVTREQYEWRATVREFDEVDAPNSVTTSVSLVAQLVRVADDSVVWSGAAREMEPIAQTRSIEAVVAGLSSAAARAIARLTDEAGLAMRRLAAAGAQQR
ncbi:MAG TPA: ABC-type transport auxiliary lipoprotein family protein [Gemmatimonadaceae bacterium]|nr:ABC-type transport auxiliary lipoprotein family protein [Gemmatimonadaceae bacterium]